MPIIKINVDAELIVKCWVLGITKEECIKDFKENLKKQYANWRKEKNKK